MISAKKMIYDLCVIGTGMTGMAAALFATNRGLSTVQVGGAGEILFASGLLDLLGVHPIEKKKIWRDPWAGINALVRDIPQHPYARLKNEDIRFAFEELSTFLNNKGLGYRWLKRRNQEIVTSMGTTKLTFGVPLTMGKGVDAFKKKWPCLIVDFRGLKGFSAHQIVATLAHEWPNLRFLRAEFPGLESFSEIYTERMARALEVAQVREKLARIIWPHLKNITAVGLPAMLGVTRSAEVMADLENRLGIAVFEIPTMLPSVAGLRLKETFEQHLPNNGVTLIVQKRVVNVSYQRQGFFVLEVEPAAQKNTLRSKCVILATGRFIGQGLHADRLRIRETLFNLPVHQPESRTHWHRQSFLDPRGHCINHAGLEVDDWFRPLDHTGQPAFEALFAAGSILAHQDWMRMKCGAGLAIATAYAAVNASLKLAK